MLDIAVTGMGCVCATGGSVGEAMAGFAKRPSAVFPASFLEQGIFAEEARLDQAAVGPVFAAGHNALWPKRSHTATDTLALARLAAREALRQGGLTRMEGGAGISPEGTLDGRLGVALGSTVGGSLYMLRACEDLERGGALGPTAVKEVDDYFSSNPALALGRELQATGPLLTVTNACASGADAIGQACRWLEAGLCDFVLAGGADALSYVSYVGFARLMLYDAALCRPFSIGRGGLNLGEGAGMLLLEHGEHARQRGARPLGYIRGYGSFNDAHHLTAPHPEGQGLERAIAAALRGMEISNSGNALDGADAASMWEKANARLAFVNVHGTGTMENDKVEDGLMRRLFPQTPLWAAKGHTGHTLGAAGALEAVFCLAALASGTMPSRLEYENSIVLNPQLSLQPADLSKTYALSTSLGFGGANAALLFQSAHAAHATQTKGEALC